METKQNLWMHVDTTHGAYNGLFSMLEGLFNANKPGGATQFLSVETNNAGTEAIIKIVTPMWWILTGAGAAVKNHPALINWYNTHTLGQVKAIIAAPAWSA